MSTGTTDSAVGDDPPGAGGVEKLPDFGGGRHAGRLHHLRLPGLDRGAGQRREPLRLLHPTQALQQEQGVAEAVTDDGQQLGAVVPVGRWAGQRPTELAGVGETLDQVVEPADPDRLRPPAGLGEVEAVEPLEVGFDGLPPFAEELGEADDSPGSVSYSSVMAIRSSSSGNAARICSHSSGSISSSWTASTSLPWRSS